MNKYLFAVLILVICCVSCTNESEKSMTTKNLQLPLPANFDTVLDGKKVGLLYLKSASGLQAAVTNYGARMVGLWVPDSAQGYTDVVVGFSSIREYVEAKERFFGAIVGRFGNRIAKGQFQLDGASYQLAINNEPNSLHGGPTGFHSRVWEMRQPDSATVVLNYVSPDGEEGYPGELYVQVTYQLTEKNELLISYQYSSNKKTIANITNHNFWNLNGEGAGTVNDHTLKIAADQYTAVDATLIPAALENVAGTAFDFREWKTIGKDLDTVASVQLKYGLGYDHNFVLSKGITENPEWAAGIKGNKSGIKMDIYTTEPGLQFYGGNFMNGLHTFKNGSKDDFRTAFCLETQHFPDSPNQPAYPTTVVEPGKVYSSKTIMQFSK